MELWLSLLDRLVYEGFYPVVYEDRFSHTLQDDLKNCLRIGPLDSLKAMSAMRACGCVLDIFDGSSRLALAARCPFLCFDERQRFNAVKEYEINDLCGRNLPRQYIFSFAALVEKGDLNVWRTNVFDHLIFRLKEMAAELDRDSWPAPVESNDIVPYDAVRKRKLKKFGTRFIRVERD
jgi:hypothetical protein